jgi:glycosyltransferase involved in cell wall biosynthesis
MRVVHISTSDRGGAGIAAVRLHLSLREHGVDSHLLTLYKFGPDITCHQVFANAAINKWPIGWLRDFSVKLKRKLKLNKPKHARKANKYLKGRAAGFENFSFPDGLSKIAEHPLVKSADVVHLHWVSEGMIDWPTFFSSCKKSICWTLHDMNPFTGGCHHADDCLGFQSNCKSCPQLVGTINPSISSAVLCLKKEVLSVLDSSKLIITAPSKWLTKLSQCSILFSRFEHVTISNVVNTDIFRPQLSDEIRKLYAIPGGKRVILFVAHHVNNFRKGTPFLIEAFRKMNREDVVLCSVGYPSEELSAIPHLHQLGYVTDELKMSSLYSLADVFVLPSIAENFPNTIVEALCCGTPCVAFNVGGVPEQINETNGLIVEEKSSLALEEAIVRVLESSFNRQEIAYNARRNYSGMSVSTSFKSIYDKLISA